MNSRDAIKVGLDMADFVGKGYLGDLTDAELLHRPAKGANHINWQLGHLIVSEHNIIESVAPGSMPALPAGFAEKYTKETASVDDQARFHTKDELLKVHDAQRAATLAALAKLTDADLDKESPENIRPYAPNWANAFSLQGSHWLMHAGQWAVVRRQLGRPPLF